MQEMMSKMDIAFPNLGIYLNNVPKSFEIFGIEIALYGVIIAVGVMAGFCMMLHSAKVSGQNPELWWDILIWEVVLSVLGARIYYVIFNFDMYRHNLLKVFSIREGGLAIYGAVIAALVTLYVFSKKRKVSFLQMADVGVTGLILGQAIGRWGNFANREVFGGYTNNLLAMRLPIDAVRARDITDGVAAGIVEGTNYIQVHPTFLYECLWNLGVLLIMLVYRKHKRFQGEVLLLYIGGYGLGRAWIEHIRTDRLLIPGTNLAVSEMLAIICFVSAIVIDVVVRIRLKKTEAEQ